MFRKPHIPLVPRTATYSCSLTSRSPRKRTVSTQTDKKEVPPFESNQILKDDLVFNEETNKTYSTALEYVNAIHAYMNKKLSEKYGECGDTKPEGNNFFKLPEVPNYATVFFMLLEKTKLPKLTSNNGNALKKKVSSLKQELQPKKFTTKDSVIEFVPEIKKLSEYKLLELKKTEREVQTIISQLTDDDSMSRATKTISDELSPFSSYKSSDSHTTPSEEGNGSKKDKGGIEENTVLSVTKAGHFILNDQETDKGEERADRESSNAVTTANEPQTDNDVTSKDNDKVIMMDIIKKRVQDEITTYLDKANASATKNHRPRLMRSHFHVVNIPPQINLLEYAQKKLERQLSLEPKPVTEHEEFQKQFFNSAVSAKRSLNIRPGTPIRVTNMFRKLSQENFTNLEGVLGGDALRREFNQSDGDSVILDDEEFEKINGHVGEQGDKKLRGNCSACREKSNPLKLTVRDMSKLNEKVLNTIGIFTERGDIRPEVIDILEEQKRTKAKDSRNKQFRSRRQWDLQIHLNPKENINSSFTSVSSDKSFTSLSSTDLKSEFNTVKNVSQQIDYGQ